LVAEPSPSVQDALLDDLNTPKAITELHKLRHAAIHGAVSESLFALVRSLRFLGLLQMPCAEWKKATQPSQQVDTTKVQTLINARNAARKAKDFKESDRIRDELVALGVVLKDSKDGTTWEVAR
jgi:cysteinyl-tRNA synthetase